MATRLLEIDIAKGICILLVVVGHSGLTGILNDMIDAFHMPFFFFISGVTTNVERPFGSFLKAKYRGLIVPFLVYYAIHIPSYAYIYKTNTLDYFEGEFLDRIDGALWFVPILFVAHMINWLVPRNSFVETVAILLFASISSILCVEGISLPWNLSILGMAVSFVILGRLFGLGGAKMMIAQDVHLFKLIIEMMIGLSILFFISDHYHMLMAFDKIEPILPVIIGALTGIGLVLVVSSQISSSSRLMSKFLAYTGANTFVFIGFSQAILKFENLYIKDYIVLKYLVLIVALYFIIYLKNRIPLAKTLRL